MRLIWRILGFEGPLEPDPWKPFPEIMGTGRIGAASPGSPAYRAYFRLFFRFLRQMVALTERETQRFAGRVECIPFQAPATQPPLFFDGSGRGVGRTASSTRTGNLPKILAMRQSSRGSFSVHPTATSVAGARPGQGSSRWDIPVRSVGVAVFLPRQLSNALALNSSIVISRGLRSSLRIVIAMVGRRDYLIEGSVILPGYHSLLRNEVSLPPHGTKASARECERFPIPLVSSIRRSAHLAMRSFVGFSYAFPRRFCSDIFGATRTLG